MATPTFTPIATYTISGSSTTYVDFSSFGGYTDLFLEANYTPSTTTALRVRFNGDTGNNYAQSELYSNGSSPASGGGTSQTGIYLGDCRSGQVNTVLVNFQNYTVSTSGKTTLSTSGNQNYIEKIVGFWNDNSPVTSMRVYIESGNLVAGSMFTLYGIADASIGAPKATGGIITYDNTYFYHTFGASGTFTPQQSLTADILVVAGGGGGAPGEYANTPGGGGGAGGLLGFASQSLSATGYTVTVGSGGTGGASGVAATNGGDSQFGSLTLVKGGGRGAGATGGGSWYAAGSQGSGGGGSGNGSIQGGGIAGPGGTATSGQGNNGGTSIYDYPSYSDYASAGGGGAGAAGSNPSSATTNGAGGNGSSTYSSWGLVTGTGENVSGTVYYAGGGGVAGTSTIARTNGGYGGGGRGALSTAGNVNPGGNGLANTGGGGGSGVNQGYGNGGNGGSGVVIIRYLKA